MRLRGQLGPWAVSGPALTTGIEALADETWRAAHRTRLKGEAERLRAMLESAGLDIVGGTDLFVLVRHAEADTLCDLLGRNGILVRAFAERPGFLRFGLPGDEAARARLQQALALSTAERQG
jgi:cobalamin biosynthetic protein CobC